jgi:hypothetical protein
MQRAVEGESAEPTIDVKKPHIWHRYTVAELGAMPRIEWLVDKMIPEKGLGQIYGPWKSHKTFVTLDMVLCIATGRPWRGRDVKRGRVVYVIGEGQSDLYDRICAWCSVNDVDVADLDGWFRAVISPVQVNDDAQLTEFGGLLKADEVKLDLIVFDTVSRNMKGDESATDTMKGFVEGCDRLKAFFGCAVIVVHHTGHDKTRSRGSTVLIAAVDVSIRVARVNENATLTRVTVEHIRAASPGDALHFEPEEIMLDFEGQRASIAMRQVDPPSAAPKNMKVRPVSEATYERLKLLIEIRDTQPATQKALIRADVPGRKQQTVSDRIKKMREDGWLDDDALTVTEEGLAYIVAFEAAGGIRSRIPDSAGQAGQGAITEGSE